MMYLKYIIEILFSCALFINAMLFVPQIIKLLRDKNANGASIVTFGGFACLQFIVVLHGFLHKDYILAIGSIVSMAACSWITFLIVWYSRRKVSD